MVDKDEMKLLALFLSVLCTTSSTGAVEVKAEDFTYMVTIEVEKGVLCNGFILDPLHVLTENEVFCVETPKSLTVRAGSSAPGKGGIERSIVNHTVREDLAIIRLNESIPLDEKTTSAVELTKPGERVSPGTDAVTVGWNEPWWDDLMELSNSSKPEPDQIRGVRYRTVDFDECIKPYDNDPFFKTKEENLICAKVSPTETRKCLRGRASPLIVNGRLAGINVKHNCVNFNFPSIFVEVSQFRDWIDQVVKGD